jgi:hypothetical protein
MKIPREVFSADDVRVGDLVQYPAILRRGHNGVRGPALRITRIEGRQLVGVRPNDIAAREYVITPVQLKENGVIV